MTIRDIIDHNTSELWITSEESIINTQPEIIIKNNSVSIPSYNWLSDEVLNAEVYLMVSKENVLFVSIYQKRKKGVHNG